MEFKLSEEKIEEIIDNFCYEVNEDNKKSLSKIIAQLEEIANTILNGEGMLYYTSSYSEITLEYMYELVIETSLEEFMSRVEKTNNGDISYLLAFKFVAERIFHTFNMKNLRQFDGLTDKIKKEYFPEIAVRSVEKAAELEEPLVFEEERTRRM